MLFVLCLRQPERDRGGLRSLPQAGPRARQDRKSTRLNSSHTVIYTLSLHDALPILTSAGGGHAFRSLSAAARTRPRRAPKPTASRTSRAPRSEEHTSELQSHSDLHSFPTRRSSDLDERWWRPCFSFFVCGSPNETEAGSEAYRKPDLARA